MIAKFIQYEHSTLGFPKIQLKWTEENGKWTEPYLVIKNVISNLNWKWEELYPKTWATKEMERFDKWIRSNYSEDVTVQG